MWRLHSYNEQKLNFHELDRRAARISDDDISTLPDLVSRLASYLPKDNENKEIYLVRAFAIWMREIIRKRLAKETPKVPEELAQFIIHGDYPTNAFEKFCQTAKIESEIVIGIKKGVDYRAGDATETAEQHTSRWSVFKCNEQWHILNTGGITKTRGFKVGDETIIEQNGEMRVQREAANIGIKMATKDDFWFCPNPEIFVMRHYPHEEKWQLLPKQKVVNTLEDFFALPSFNITYYQSNLCLLSENTCKLNSKKGRTKISLMVCGNNSIHTIFSYKMSFLGETSDLPNPKDLPRLVCQTRENDIVSFEVRYPIEGIYFLTLYVFTTDSTSRKKCCTFRLTCTKVDPNLKKLPIDTGSLGFGFNGSAIDAGLTKPSTDKAKLVVKPSKDGNNKETIAFHLVDDIAITTKYVTTVYATSDSDHDDIAKVEFQDLTDSTVSDEINKLVVKFGLKNEGEHCLAIGSREKNTTEAYQHFMYYLVNSSEDADEEQARRETKVAKCKAIYEEKMSRKKKTRDDLESQIDKLQKETDELVNAIIRVIQTEEVSHASMETDTADLVKFVTRGMQTHVDTMVQSTQTDNDVEDGDRRSGVCILI